MIYIIFIDIKLFQYYPQQKLKWNKIHLNVWEANMKVHQHDFKLANSLEWQGVLYMHKLVWNTIYLSQDIWVENTINIVSKDLGCGDEYEKSNHVRMWNNWYRHDQ